MSLSSGRPLKSKLQSISGCGNLVSSREWGKWKSSQASIFCCRYICRDPYLSNCIRRGLALKSWSYRIASGHRDQSRSRRSSDQCETSAVSTVLGRLASGARHGSKRYWVTNPSWPLTEFSLYTKNTQTQISPLLIEIFLSIVNFECSYTVKYCKF